MDRAFFPLPRRIRPACLLLLAALSLAGTSCVTDAPPRLALAPATTVGQRLGLVIWVDGLDIEHFHALQRAGRLPNITRYLLDRGVTVEGAVASLPTITYANNVSFTTGLLPGHHGIVGNKWFDRDRLILQDYGFIRTYRQVDTDFVPPTIYELLAGDFTATILTPVRRGATRNFDNWMSAGVAWYFNLQKTVNVLTTARFSLIADVANGTGRWPKFILAYFVTPDTVGHAHGPQAAPYTDMLLHVDRQVGHICRSLESAGLLERTYVTLVSDHGFVDTPRHADLAQYFSRELKVPTRGAAFGRDVPFEQRLRHFAPARAVVVADGNRRCAIHLRPGEHWWQRPTEKEIDAFLGVHGRAGKTRRPAGEPASGPAPGPETLPDRLARLEGVDLVAVRRGAGSVRVQDRSGSGVIERTVRDGARLYRYGVTSGTDPLGYASNPQAARLMDGSYHDADAWLQATLDTDRPDVAVQLVELSDSPRAGDVMVFAADGWDFAGCDRGGHGGLLRHEVVVPWVWAGPDLPAGGRLRGARTVDLMPTMLHLIGRGEAVPPGLDGRDLSERLRNAGLAP